MNINQNLPDNEINELSRSQILEASLPEEEAQSLLRNRAGLKRDFKSPEDYIDGFNYGIDVSHWQGSINWSDVAQAKPSYAYIKATQGATYLDPKMNTNVPEAKGVGVPIACYHFLSANTTLQGQIDNFLRHYEPYHEDDNYPPCMDLEWDYNSNRVDRWTNKSPEFIAEKSLGWLEGIHQRLGVKPIFYTNKYWFEERLGATNKSLSDYKVWMSRYGKYGNEEPPMMQGYQWVMWQFTDRGKIAGVSGRVDTNLSAGGFPQQVNDEPNVV